MLFVCVCCITIHHSALFPIPISTLNICCVLGEKQPIQRDMCLSVPRLFGNIKNLSYNTLMYLRGFMSIITWSRGWTLVYLHISPLFFSGTCLCSPHVSFSCCFPELKLPVLQQMKKRHDIVHYITCYLCDFILFFNLCMVSKMGLGTTHWENEAFRGVVGGDPVQRPGLVSALS